MDENPQTPPSSGWSFGKVLGVVLGLIGMAGFGVCTLCGVVISFDNSMGGVWPFVLAGAVMTFLSTWLVMTMYRKAREAREASQARDSSKDFRNLP
jgi:hypothetical protein